MGYRKLLLLLSIALILTACAGNPTNPLVAEFGDYKIYLDEFENAYARNAGGIEKASKDSLESYKKFLDLYLNYKIKLRDAQIRGYTNDADMKRELIEYKGNIGGTLFVEKEIIEPRVKKLFERRKTEIYAAHLLLLPDSTMDESKVVELGNQLIDRINKGEEFEKLTAEYSKDNYTKNKGGVVGWVIAGQILSPEIEDALYSAEAGKIYPKLVKSNFGYHILKAVKVQPRRHLLKAQHILAASRDSSGVEDTAKAYAKILDIQKRLQAGESFEQLALKYSDDKYSARQYGELGSFGRGRMVPEFEEAAFAMKVGEISPIVKTSFGYHIIKLTGEEPLPSYEEMKEELKEISRRIHYKEDFKAAVEKLKNEFGFKLNKETVAALEANVDSIMVLTGFASMPIYKKVGGLTIFTTNTNKYITDSLITYLIQKGVYVGRKLDKKQLNDALEQYIGDSLVREKAMVYDLINPEFAKLMDDYEKGIYLFKILEEEVWSKITVDSVKMQDYYDKHKDKFQWKDRVEFKEIYMRGDTTANKVYALLQGGADFDSLYTIYNQRTGYENRPGYSGLVEINFNDLATNANALNKPGEFSKPFKFEDGWSIVRLIRKEAARGKTFAEAKAEISGLLQESESKRLEEEYLARLKAIYKPKTYYEELAKAFKH